MNETLEIKKLRTTLYEEVWAEPMTAVAKKYDMSDSGLRKRCKTLNVPLPPSGYWAKVKAGKPVSERPPLPPYVEIILRNGQDNTDDAGEIYLKDKKISIELLDLEGLSIEELEMMHGFDLFTPGSLETFSEWCKKLVVPGRINTYDDLISKHKLELEYRDMRDKEYPFRDDYTMIQKSNVKIKNRNNESVLPIEVSNKLQSRSYRIIDTIIKSFRILKANFTVDQSDREDNISITLLKTKVTFDMREGKIKRRRLTDQTKIHDLRPSYEDVFDGNLTFNWKLFGAEYGYNIQKNQERFFSYGDSKENPLEKQISTIILEVYEECCNNEILYQLDRKKESVKYEQRQKELQDEEQAKNLVKQEKIRQVRKESLVKSIEEHADNWFKHQKLYKFADELEIQLAIIEDTETIQLIKKYIELVRVTAEKSNPLSRIIHEMKEIEIDI